VKVLFDRFVLDTDARQLFLQDEERHLTPKAFDLLSLLIESRPNAVAKAECYQRLWPATFVTDANIAILIAEIRAALDDSARRQRYIRTVHRFGYAFAAPASNVSEPRRRAASRFGGWLTSKHQRFALKQGEHVVGRAEDVDICLDHESVSRRHARVVVSADRVTIEDLGSKNGTYVAGERVVAPHPLHDGDRIRVGSVAMTFRVRSSGATTRSATPSMPA
jgi:DNA-binding winged helix-turn-helix (wHTH) protein